MATYEQIAKANEAIKTTPIEKTNTKTGEKSVKDYAEVNQRIKAFRMVFPNGFITTEMLSNDNGVCIFRAECGYCEAMTDIKHVLGTGTAYEKENSTFINRTSYIENCETSAVGRALGMAGFGIDTSVASLEEVQNAMLNQDGKPLAELQEKKASAEQIARIKELVTDIDGMLKYYKIGSIEELTSEQAAILIMRKGAKNNG